MNPLLARRRPPAGDDNLIPMINVVFLLLIFFMVASRIEAPVAEQLVPPDARSDALLPDRRLELQLDRTGRLSADGQALTLAQLSARLQGAGPELSLTLRADKALTAADLEPLLALLREAGLARVTLVTARVAP